MDDTIQNQRINENMPTTLGVIKRGSYQQPIGLSIFHMSLMDTIYCVDCFSIRINSHAMATTLSTCLHFSTSFFDLFFCGKGICSWKCYAIHIIGFDEYKQEYSKCLQTFIFRCFFNHLYYVKFSP